MRGHEAPGTAVLQQAILQAAVVCDVSMQTAGCGAAPSKINAANIADTKT